MSDQTHSWRDAAVACLLVGLAFALRILRLDQLFEGGEIFLFPDDPPYHVRRALMMLASWPRLPAHDPMLNFPDGADVYWPPAMTWLLAGLARLCGARGAADRPLVELIAAWVPPAVGALTVLASFVATRRLLGVGAATVAAVVLATMPAHVQYTAIGRYDHHVFEPLLAWLVPCAIAFAATTSWRRGFWAWAAAGAAGIGLALAAWPGALLHLGLIAAALVVTACLLATHSPDSARRIARAGAASFALALPAAGPALASSQWAPDAVFFAPSALHLACLGSTAAVLASMVWPRSRPDRAVGLRARALLAIAAAGAALIAVGPFRRALLEGASYLASGFAALADESQGLLHDPRDVASLAGWLALGAALACLALVPRGATRLAEGGGAAVMLIAAVGTAALIAGMVAVRWLVAWAPFGAFAVAVVWSLGLRPLGERWTGARRRRCWALCAVAAAGLATPALLDVVALELATPASRRAQRFLRELRQLTPSAVDGEHAADARPRYGVLANWSVGHLVTHLAGRPTLANNFFGVPWHDRANRRALRLLMDPDCERVALAMAELRLRYVLITPIKPSEVAAMAALGGHDPRRYLDAAGRPAGDALRSLPVRLGLRDGESIVVDGARLPACARFRLTAELDDGPGTHGTIKLYERVAGAELRVRAAPGVRVAAALVLRTRGGREIRWLTQATADARGRASLRVPYPTDGSCWSLRSPCAVVATGPYRIFVGAGPASTARVREAEIADGSSREVGG